MSDAAPIVSAPATLPAWASRSVNLADARIGARAIAASDEFFAPLERLLNPEPAVFIPGKYDANGKWMDGWESRRRRGGGNAVGGPRSAPEAMVCMASASWNTAAIGALRPLMRPCGMATPCPRLVEPRRSRANRLSVTRARERPCWLSNSSPASSNARFLLVTSTLTNT